MKANIPSAFNLRVYGLLFDLQGHVLVTDELRMGDSMTKFPGGGLEFGEGTIECLKREFREELALEIHQIDHFYTTDFYQKAMYFEQMQLISIYYTVQAQNDFPNFPITPEANYSELTKEGDQLFRWVPMKQFSHTMTFPIDQHVAKLIEKQTN